MEAVMVQMSASESRERLFAFMSRNALRATAFFKIPPNQVFEVGAYVEL